VAIHLIEKMNEFIEKARFTSLIELGTVSIAKWAKIVKFAGIKPE